LFHHIRDFSQHGSWRARLFLTLTRTKILSKFSIGLVAEERLHLTALMDRLPFSFTREARKAA
ncbi:MAG: hypothetical protein ABR973_17325, partial [Candidatus Acidiferrales bacterium]